MAGTDTGSRKGPLAGILPADPWRWAELAVVGASGAAGLAFSFAAGARIGGLPSAVLMATIGGLFAALMAEAAFDSLERWWKRRSQGR
ncbi:MAG: hypothetical protein MUF03_12475 [Rubrivivax sp.]|jgi:hypothetical protein|nr:hypothetical protein [Rubrivivax sp.]